MARDDRLLVVAARTAAFWSFAYGCYRLYYAAGGLVGLAGTPVSMAQFRLINAVAAIALFVTAAVPLVCLGRWRRHRAIGLLLILSWLIAVGCIMHALVDIVQRIASLAGVLVIDYPLWIAPNRRALDLQDLLFNEPWFLVEGLLWAVMAWAGALHTSPRRWWWIGSAVAAIVVLTAAGIMSAFGVIGRAIVF